MEPAAFKQGMRRLASGVSLVTTTRDGTPHGFIATSVSSVCAEPSPALLVCVNHAVSSYSALVEAGVFCVNILREPDIDLARQFSSPALREQRFTNSSWHTMKTGSPALSTALVSFDCEVFSTHMVRTHTIFVANVVDARLAEPDQPLLYFDGNYKALAFAGGAFGSLHSA